MNRIGSSKRLTGLGSLTILIAVLTLLLRVSPASAAAAPKCTTPGGCLQTAAPNCLQDEYNFESGTTTKTLGCTAGDVKVASASNPRDAKGNPISQCVQGSSISFIADFNVVTTATQRENIGLYMATAGQASALTGTCTDNIISPLHDPGANGVSTCSNTVGSTQCLGSALYHQFDSAPDNCGDTASADGTSQIVTVQVNDVKCEPAPGCTGSNCPLVLPNCTSWQQTSTTLCESDPPTTGWPYVTAAIPGTTSKCSCNNKFTVPIQVLTPGLGVTKTASPTSITGTDGGTSNYTVTVTNQNNGGSDTVEQICDNKYGNIATAAGFGGPACPKGDLCSTGAGTTCATNISCPTSGSLPAVLTNPGDSLTCTFTGFVPEDSSVTDTVTATALASNGASLTGTASATVTTGDAPASATFIKTLGSANPTAACATVVYDVEVDNTSLSGTDESETLTSLSDNVFGDITTIHGNAGTNGSVVSTTCANNDAIAVGGKYTCSFNGVMCGTPGSITSPTVCAAGLEATDMLSGTLTGDEIGDTVTITPGSRTVEVCFSASSN